ncbi:Doubled CXXCH motif (Paired_CXXCH_1), partial [Candidatus Kryptobacter tengchongensis]
MKTAKILTFYALSILLVPLTFIFVAFSDLRTSERGEFYGDNVKQWMNIKFSHRFHAENVGAECTDCHAGALTSEKSSDFLLPKQATCFNCHDEKSTPCEFCHLDTKN